jgi:hypothetical protein
MQLDAKAVKLSYLRLSRQVANLYVKSLVAMIERIARKRKRTI